MTNIEPKMKQSQNRTLERPDIPTRSSQQSSLSSRPGHFSLVDAPTDDIVHSSETLTAERQCYT